MRNISFVTQFSKKYQGPLVTISIDDKPIAQAIPINPRQAKGESNSSDFATERKQSSSIHEVYAEEFSKAEYALYDYEVSAIIEYLTTEEFFRDFH